MTGKEAQIALMKGAEVKLDAVCYLHTTFDAGIVHHCERCPLKEGVCIFFALKNAIRKIEDTTP